jgi:hypothetical protein
MFDRRYIKIEVDHAQSRTKRKRLNFTLSGWAFLNGVLNGCFISPITGKIQPTPNSEEPEFQTLNTGRFRKLQLSDGTAIDSHTPGLDFVSFGPDHADQGIKVVGDNVTGVGFKTNAPLAQNTGYTATFYAYGQGTDQDGVLGEMFWANDQNLTGGGVGIKVFLDGRVEIYKDDVNKPVFRGSCTGGGYTPGTVQGGSYARATDEYVAVRVEVSQNRFITITSSRAGVMQYAAPWAIDRYNEDGVLTAAAQPVLPAKKWGWYVPKGGAAVIAAPVVYGFTSPYAISEAFAFEETPTYVGPVGTDVLTGRVIPYSPAVTVTLLKEDGTTTYDRTSRKFRAKVSFSGAAFVSGVVGAYPRIRVDTPEPEGGAIDVTEYMLSLGPYAVEDGPMGTSADLVLKGDCPVPFIDEQELRPFRLTLIPHPDDPDSPEPCIILDAVGDVPEWVDGYEPESQSIHIRLEDRMRLVREAQFSETVVFDGLPLCQPPGDGESVVSICLREGGMSNAELVDLPRVENEDGSLFLIDDTPGQRAGEWNFAAKARQLVSDILEEAWDMAPQYAWGLKPTVDGLRAYAVDVEGDETEVATFYRTLDDAETDDDYVENELGAWPLLYGRGHKRIKLPKEGNVVRVNGYDPGTGEGIQAFAEDVASRDPASANGPDKLGVSRIVFVRKRSLTTQTAVNRVAIKLRDAIAKRQYLEPWPAFMRFKADGSPVWRADMVMLRQAKRDGSNSKVRVSALTTDILDENGAGLMDSEGGLAPVSVRLTDYCGGAIVGRGGSAAFDIAGRQIAHVMDGGSSYGETNVDGSMAFVVRLT